MLEVTKLTKTYGDINALKGISFEVNDGEIVGFLGPNGAGKSTTMRIITGYLPATSGRVRVDGFDVLNDSLEVRQRVGYLPEHTPLYTDMRIGEFLRYRAHIKGVRWRDRSRRVDEAMDKTLLRDRASQMISTLSKGYRQRVGIADALLAQPRLLILDEPTIGLDPNQVRQVRELIQTLAERQTVILSTHILAEVEMICQRVVMLHHGRKVADDKISDLIASYDQNEVIVQWTKAQLNSDKFKQLQKQIAELEFVAQCKVNEKSPVHEIIVQPNEHQDIRGKLSEFFVGQGLAITELKRKTVSLEDVFSHLTLVQSPQTQAGEAA